MGFKLLPIGKESIFTGRKIFGIFFSYRLFEEKDERMEENVHYISMAIPNEKVRVIFKNTVLNWFGKDKVR